MIHNAKGQWIYQMNIFDKSYNGNWKELLEWMRKYCLVFLFWGEMFSTLSLLLSYIFLFVYLSSFLNTPTDISNFNYLFWKCLLKRTLYYLLCCSKLQLFRNSCCLFAMLSVTRYSTHFDLKVTNYRSLSSCHQGFTCFSFFSSHFIFALLYFPPLIEWRYLVFQFPLVKESLHLDWQYLTFSCRIPPLILFISRVYFHGIITS